MAAADPQGGQQYWLNGLPVSGLSQSGTGNDKYWGNGVPSSALIPFHTANALLIGSGRGQARATCVKGLAAPLIGSGRGKTRVLSVAGMAANLLAGGRGEALAISSSIDAQAFASGRGQTVASSIHGGVALPKSSGRTEAIGTAAKSDSSLARATGRTQAITLSIPHRTSFALGTGAGQGRATSAKGDVAFVLDSSPTSTSPIASVDIRSSRITPEKYWKDGLPWSGMSSDLWGQQRFWLNGLTASALVPPFHLATSLVISGGRGQLRASSIKGSTAEAGPASARGQAQLVFIITSNSYADARGQTTAVSSRGVTSLASASERDGSAASSQMGGVANPTARAAGFLRVSSYSVALPVPAEQTFWQAGVPWRGVIIDLAKAGRQKFWLNGLPESVIQPLAPVRTNPRISARPQLTVRAIKDLSVHIPVSGRGDVRMAHEYIDPTIIPNRYTFWQRGVPYAYVHYHYTAGTQKYFQKGLAFTSIETTPPRISLLRGAGKGQAVASSIKQTTVVVVGSGAGEQQASLAARPTAPVISGASQIRTSCRKGVAALLGTAKSTTFDSAVAFDSNVPFDGQAVDGQAVLSGRGDGQATKKVAGLRRTVYGSGQAVASSTFEHPSVVRMTVAGQAIARAIRGMQVSIVGTNATESVSGSTRHLDVRQLRAHARGQSAVLSLTTSFLHSALRTSARGQARVKAKQKFPRPKDRIDHTIVDRLLDLANLTNLCRAGMSPAVASSVLQAYLTDHFANHPMSPVNSPVRIATNTRFDPKQAGFPAVIISRGEQASQRVVIGDRSVDRDGQPIYTRVERMSHRIFCIAEADGQAEDLALEVFDALTFASPVFRGQLPFLDFEVVKIGQLAALEGMGNRLGVTIEVSYVYETGWMTEQVGPRLKTLSLV